MKTIHRCFFILSLFTGLISCKKDFLDVPDNTLILRQEYVTDLKSTQDYLNGIYRILGTDFYYGYNVIYPELIADNIKPVDLAAGVMVSHYNWNQQSEDRKELFPSGQSLAMNGIWNTGYKIVRSCNFIIENVDRYRNEDPGKSDNIKGQALFIRALILHQLVNIFAQPYSFTADASHIGIPYVVTSDWTQSVSRDPVTTVYEKLISDLNQAIELLPLTSASALYVNSNAAKALLCRVYLYKGEFAMAKKLSREVIIVSPFLSIGNGYPNNLFKLLPSAQTEVLFELSPGSSTSLGNNYNTFFTGRYFRSPIQFYATNDVGIVLNERSNDVRKNWVKIVSGNWNIMKFPTGIVADISNTNGSYYHPVIRSSEMYLIAAESYLKLNNEDSARYYLDIIRKRSDVTASNTIATGTALLDSIYKEFRKEFAFEGMRMFDLLRWKKGVNRIDAPNLSAKNLPYSSNKAIAPLSTLDVELAGLEQNHDY